MGITDSILSLLDPENKQIQQTPPAASWVKDLIDKRYQPKTERLKRTPIGFEFKREPFDPSSYYRALGTFRDISRLATGVTQQEAANRAEAEQQRAYERSQAALKGVNPNFLYDGGNFEFNGKSRKYGLKHVSPNTAKAADYWGSRYGILNIGGYREKGSVPGSDHPKGRALDFMINNIKNGKATGTALANDLIKNYKAWNIKYVIWNRYIWSPGRGWRKYNGPSPHTDHVHASFNK